MRVLLADDKPEVRSALRLLLEQSLALRIAGEAADAMGLMASARATAPDLILLDWELPGLAEAGMPGLMAALHAAGPTVAIIALSGLPGARAAALAAGADAFVSKSDPPEALLEALTAVLAKGHGQS